MKSYEGMAAYKAGMREGRVEAISEFCEEMGPGILNRLALIVETTKENSTKELALDCYNYINSLAYNEMDILFIDKEPNVKNDEINLSNLI